MSTDIETIVIGGGVVGLAIANACASAGKDVMLLERNLKTGQETSSRNSEVIHAGLYYTPGSLRARFCVEGCRALYRFAKEHGVDVRPYGKMLVATDESQIPRLRNIEQTAKQNGVHNLRWLEPAEAKSLEPDVFCVAAMLSPNTGVIDSHSYMIALEGSIQHNGGMIVCGTNVVAIRQVGKRHFELVIESNGTVSAISARSVIIAAGLETQKLAVSIADLAPEYKVPKLHLAKGYYFALSGKAPFKRLIYPMPQVGGLGVHVTLDTGGAAKFGPDVEWVSSASYGFDDPGNLRMKNFETEIRRYWPGLPDNALQPAYTGIRPKISGKNDPQADFMIDGPEKHGLDGLVLLFGIESPGLTSSLAIGDFVANLLNK